MARSISLTRAADRRVRDHLGVLSRRLRQRGALTLIFESSGQAELDFPDNLAVSPQGSLLLCEDGGGDQFMRGVTLDGRIFDFAMNLENDYEWAGATFADADPSWNDRKIRGERSTAGRTLGSRHAVRESSGRNRWHEPAGGEGMTFAIWDPWGDGAL